MMKHSNLKILIAILLGLVVLVGLGTWQVNRLFWKQALIERVEARLQSEPMPLATLAETGLAKRDHEYQPVTLAGTFDHAREVYFFTTGAGGASGWNVHTPFKTRDGELVIVNRGFVPFELKSALERQDGLLQGKQQVTGLLRFPLAERPFGSLENSISEKEFYWRNVSEMAQAMELPEKEFLPVIVDQKLTDVPGGWPRGGTTIIAFPNNHLQYAITWYGLALTLLGVGGYFLYSRRQGQNER